MVLFIFLLCLSCGIGMGALFSKKKNLFKAVDHFVQLTVALLLFILGMSIGENQAIVNNLANLGLDALLLTIGAVMGSILAVYPVYLRFFKGKE